MHHLTFIEPEIVSICIVSLGEPSPIIPCVKFLSEIGLNNFSGKKVDKCPLDVLAEKLKRLFCGMTSSMAPLSDMSDTSPTIS
jgi:hypothetical protein